MLDAKELMNVFTGGEPASGAAASDLGTALERGKKAASELASVVSAALDQAQAKLQSPEAQEYLRRAKELVDKDPDGTFVVLERGKKAANEVTSVVSAALDQAQAKLKSPEAQEYLRKAKELVDKDPVGTFAVLGSVAAVLLGPQAVLPAIGIAYKALRNYQEGKPLTEGVPGLKQLTAPEGSAFREQAHANAIEPTQITGRAIGRFQANRPAYSQMATLFP